MALIDTLRLVAGYGMAGGSVIMGALVIVMIWQDWHRKG